MILRDYDIVMIMMAMMIYVYSGDDDTIHHLKFTESCMVVQDDDAQLIFHTIDDGDV